jgi:hypothetical protein
LDLLTLEDVTVGCSERYIRATTNIGWAQARKNEGLNNFLFTVSRTIHNIPIADRSRNYVCKRKRKYNKSGREYDRRKKTLNKVQTQRRVFEHLS